MQGKNSTKYSLAGFIFLCLLLGYSANAQRIIIDKPVSAGELTLFPDMEDENAYYYLPDKLQLATDANGKPQFSFLRYVENVRSSGGEDEIREGIGGGIVHAVVELSVSPEQVTEAKNALRQINADGVIKGPVMYNSGTFAIISSFANTAGDLTKQVVGLGKAPLIDGQKAAVSMELTKKGAKILWESFQTPTPDMSFSFEMELEGYRAPKKALIEADFEKMYSHHGFQLGASGSSGNIVFGGEIDLAFDDLRNNGAIKITNMGADEDMGKLIETAYNKLTTMMFDPIGGTGNPLMKDLVKSVTGKKSPMDRATDLYKQNKGSSAKSAPTKKAPAKNSSTKKTSMRLQYPTLNDNLLLAYNGAGLYTNKELINPFFIDTPQKEWKAKHIKQLAIEHINLMRFVSTKEKNDGIKLIGDDKYCSMKAYVDVENSLSNKANNLESYQVYLLTSEEIEAHKTIIEGTRVPDDEYKQLIKDRIIQLVYEQDFLNESQKSYILNTWEPDASKSWGLTQILTYAAWVRTNGNPVPTKSAKSKESLEKIVELGRISPTASSTVQPSKENNIPEGSGLEEMSAITTGNTKTDTTAAKKEGDKKVDTIATNTTKPSASEVKTEDNKKATASAAAAKKVDDSKKKADDKKKSSSTSKESEAKKKEKKSDFKLAVMASYQFKKIKQKGTFKINLNKYTADKLVLRFDENIGKIDCSECFHQVNLDDPLFKQREIVAMIDGFNFDDFGKYINYVSLKMRKTHQSGDITYDEVRIDRDNFVKAANNFKLFYGWKGDDNRTNWLDYEYQAQWSFYGGNEVASDWSNGNANAINLTPPYLRKTIELEADPEMLKDKNVRSIIVKLFYKVGNSEEVQQVTLMPSREQFSSTIDIMLPKGTLDYEYEITWRLTGNKTTSSGRQSTSESILFVDEVAP